MELILIQYSQFPFIVFITSQAVCSTLVNADQDCPLCFQITKTKRLSEIGTYHFLSLFPFFISPTVLHCTLCLAIMFVCLLNVCMNERTGYQSREKKQIIFSRNGQVVVCTCSLLLAILVKPRLMIACSRPCAVRQCYFL